MAPLHLDTIGPMGSYMKGQTISPMELPDFAQEHITNDVQLRQGIAEIERMAQGCAPGKIVPLAHQHAADVCAYMNIEQRQRGNPLHVERLYWGVSASTLHGVVEQVRTALTVLVSEIQATMPGGRRRRRPTSRPTPWPWPWAGSATSSP